LDYSVIRSIGLSGDDMPFAGHWGTPSQQISVCCITAIDRIDSSIYCRRLSWELCGVCMLKLSGIGIVSNIDYDCEEACRDSNYTTS